MNRDLHPDLWTRLTSGMSLDGMGLPMRDGRLQIADLILPKVRYRPIAETSSSTISAADRDGTLDSVRLTHLEFMRAGLDGLRLENGQVQDCVFRDSRLKDVRLFGCEISDSAFTSCDCRGALLGGTSVQGRETAFSRVTFLNTDLRQTIYTGATFANSSFEGCRFEGVRFNASRFHHVSFSGEVRDVIFYGTQASHFAAEPRGELNFVDFSRATLRNVEFRGFQLDSVIFPDDRDHIVFGDPARRLRVAMDNLATRDDIGAKKAAAYLGVVHRWTRPDQHVGVVNSRDIEDISDAQIAAEVARLLS